MSITVSGLSKFYGQQKAVDHISFSIGSGAIVGFLGPNGAGKSTTMKMITGYLQPDEGTIDICSNRVLPNSTETKKMIGYLPESNPLYYDLYVKEYLQFIAGIHQIHQPQARIREIIDLVGLTPESAKKLGQLSKGYKQRAGLAAALLHDPKVLILDEPTTGLDPNQILEIREVIKTLGKEKTILFSSHILQEVEALCDRVIIINKGKLVADDRLINLRQQSGNMHQVNISFQESVAEDLLGQLPHCTTINQISSTAFHLGTQHPEQLSKELMTLSLEQKWNIVSMQTGKVELEDIFKQLTKTTP